MRRTLIAGVIVSLVVVGCSTTGRVDGPVLTSPNLIRGGNDAGIGGILRFDEARGCLLLTDEFGASPIPMVWPAGASWLSDPPRVRLRDGVIAEPGMWVSGSGGFFQPEYVDQHVAGSEVADAAAACVGPTGEIAVFNFRSKVRVSANPPDNG
jgi:hypothetical protein